MREERGNYYFGLGSSESRHIIVSGESIAQNAAGAIRAGGDGVKVIAKIGLGGRVEGCVRAGEVGLANCGALRVCDRNQSRAWRRPGACAADLKPAGIAIDAGGIVDGVPGSGVGVVRHVRYAASS